MVHVAVQRILHFMFYQLYEMNHAAMAPWRVAADVSLTFWGHGSNPLSKTYMGRAATASLRMFERLTRRYGKPGFDIAQTSIDGHVTAIEELTVVKKPFGNLLHFAKANAPAKQQKLLIVAPMSGHYATLLRHTVEGMLPHFDVYITDWNDARDVPLSEGHFDLDDYTDYVTEFLQSIGERAHVMAVCQPSVPVLAAVALMSAHKDPLVPKSMILMGGPVDTRCNPTAVNKAAEGKSVAWFRSNVTMPVPLPLAGAGRRVYPGFLQLTGFMTMNLDRHMTAHRELYWHLVEGDGNSIEKREAFYDEYMSVMDLTAEFYLQTVDRVFIHHDLPSGTYRYRGELVDPSQIKKTSLLTIEGENDDISGVGQTAAAHALCSGLNAKKKAHHLQLGVGHYGVFSGSRFLQDVVPVITQFCNAPPAAH
jgi:poly(3-hydroxybutyrate) depolymerase